MSATAVKERRLGGNNKQKSKEEMALEVTIKNFGPISRGTIDVKPLTILVGPNNSGKSYSAMLIHSILESLVPVFTKEDLSSKMTSLLVGGIYSTLIKVLAKKLQKEVIFNELITHEVVKFPEEILEIVSKEFFRILFEEKLSDELQRAFATPLRDLVHVKKRGYFLKVKIGTYSISLEYKPNQKQKKIKIVEYPRMSINIEFHRTSEFKANLIVHRTLLENTYIIEINEGFLREKSKRERELFAFILSDQIIKIIAKEFFKNIRKCYYLPAARSGILQGHKALVASIVKTAPYIGLERLEIPKFSGVVSDFIASIITLPEKKSRLYKLAEQFENELIEGHILVKKTEEFRYPEIEYLFQKTEIPLQRASSTVSEMAPLFLYLKYLVGPGSLLIIEEPEAHLHPANQRILAKYLVRLIREGVNILITTHSEYLLEQLNNFILLSKVSPEVRVRKYNYEENDYLLNNEVGVYIFKYNEDLQGYIIDSLQITGEEGIPQDEFLRVHEALYEESLQIRKSIESEMGK